MDLLDEHIIEVLGQNAYQNIPEISRKLKVTGVTVRRRIKELLKNDTLRIVGVVDPTKLGYNIPTVIGLDIEHAKVASAIEKLSNIREVNWISTTTGRFDIIVLVRFQSTDDLSEFINKKLPQIDGLKNSETFVCLHIEKGKYSLMYTNAH